MQDEAQAPARSSKSTAAVAPKSMGIGKDPTTDTAFLPDKEREQQEQHMREQLKQEYELRQQVHKAEAALDRRHSRQQCCLLTSMHPFQFAGLISLRCPS